MSPTTDPTGRRPVVLVAIKGLGLGGAERLISEAVPFWDRDRFDYHVAYFVPWKDQLVPELERAEVPVAMLGDRRGMDPRSAGRLRSHIHAIGADLVHVHSPAVAVLARMVSQVPVVYTEHNVADSYRQPTRSLNRLTYGRNAAVTAVSQAVAESLASFSGPEPAVIPNGVSVSIDPQAAAAARQELGLPAGAEMVVAVGNIRPHKGHGNLIAAASILAGLRPKAAIVSIGGEKHPGDLARLRSEADAAGLGDTIRFLGRRDDARAFIAAADVFVNPSDVEGLPVVILEAMALGRPIVATAVGGVPGVIEDGVSGRLVPAKDPAALASAVADVLARPDKGSELGRAAAANVEQRHGMAPMVAAFERLYGEVLGG